MDQYLYPPQFTDSGSSASSVAHILSTNNKIDLGIVVAFTVIVLDSETTLKYKLKDLILILAP